MSNPKHLIIHGHFYQPPRENPWIGSIEIQPSAAPEHDWNEKICQQCYTPNAYSRILDSRGKIEEFVNNYEYLSFNFGPTLSQWIKKKYPDTFRKIIEADKISQERNNGHGNALAQVYNHLIMPLATEEDQQTQIIWGKKYFFHEFQRDPEGMWLAETAINMATVRALIEAGLLFTILSPYQAERTRKFETSDWIDVSHGNVDISQPYRIYYKDPSGKKDYNRFLDVFFYHGPLSHAMSFENLLTNAENLFRSFSEYWNNSAHNNPLLTVATDGELFGHHEPFADMCLAFLFKRICPAQGIDIVNFGSYLAQHPPVHEVELKNDMGEGTAWSCFHGVGRWRTDCGCQTGGQPGWNQQWRAPLRQGLDKLQNEISIVFRQQAMLYLENPQAARNDYIDILLTPTAPSLRDFFKKHARYNLEKDEQNIILELLHSQLYGQLMFTSCAWFFCEISGIETIQILKYAARAVELSCSYTKKDLANILLMDLRQAISNIQKERGDEIYNRTVLQSEYSIQKIASNYLFDSFINQAFAPRVFCEYHFTLLLQESLNIQEFLSTNQLQVEWGTLNMVHETLQKKHQFYFIILLQKDTDLSLYLSSQSKPLEHFRKDRQLLLNKDLPAFLKSQFEFSFNLKDIQDERRIPLLHRLIQPALNKILTFYSNEFDRIDEILSCFSELSIIPPASLTHPFEYLFYHRWENTVKNYKTHKSHIYFNEALNWLTGEWKKFGPMIDKKIFNESFQNLLEFQLDFIGSMVTSANIQTFINTLEIAFILELELNRSILENKFFDFFQEVIRPYQELLEQKKFSDPDLQKIVTLLNTVGKMMNFNMERMLERKEG